MLLPKPTFRPNTDYEDVDRLCHLTVSWQALTDLYQEKPRGSDCEFFENETGYPRLPLELP